MTYNTNDETPAERPLKAYAFDPSQGRNLGNFMTVPVRYEKLQTLALVEAPKARKVPRSRRCQKDLCRETSGTTI